MVGNMEISNYVRAICPKYFPDLNKSDLIVSQAHFKERSTYPIVKLNISLKAHPSQVEASLIVKTAPRCEENIEGLTEYKNMEALKGLLEKLPSSKFESKALGFINPLDYNHKLNVLVSEFVPHKRLSKRIFSTCKYFNNSPVVGSVREDIYSSGKWLKLFHQIKSKSKKLLVETDYFHRMGFYLQHARDMRLNFPAIAKVEQFLIDNKEKLSALNLPQGRIHGDFGPQNIGVGDDGKIYVFDLQRSYDECIYHDITYFLVTLETLNPYPKHFTFSRKKILSLGQEFLLGYRHDGEEKSEWNDLLFHIYYLRCLLERRTRYS